jgi:hypothetical protein
VVKHINGSYVELIVYSRKGLHTSAKFPLAELYDQSFGWRNMIARAVHEMRNEIKRYR